MSSIERSSMHKAVEHLVIAKREARRAERMADQAMRLPLEPAEHERLQVALEIIVDRVERATWALEDALRGEGRDVDARAGRA